ncbi:N-acetylglucosaminyl deacetylase, LmbE family [Pedococcus cremeus]|uniref:N-acetylglucosaminyl deacetylase, LmbE family n=1 Tax=Pedococcus cremeus TaxID=587636 RepID=A0A1H9UQ49_9MICO|nr:PIG-L deacetylase family protein [Pedococcus cremeus]SES11660.1 N-acetylglucosaminyl deacetylase, LmbE family [Pedococcus cremeus]
MSVPALPKWRSVLAVVAHPDDESFGLGAVLSSFIDAGARVAVLCLTHGEASTLHGVEGDLTDIRAAELRAAADALGVEEVELMDFPDGGLASMPLEELAAAVGMVATRRHVDGLLGFDLSGVTGHPDHTAATRAAMAAAERLGLPVLGWTLPFDVGQQLTEEFGAAFVGHAHAEIDLRVTVSRQRQLTAVACHPSQALPGSVLWRRLELLGDREYLRLLRSA